MNTSQAAPFSISVMTPAEMAIAIDWARREGWNPGLQDAAAFRCADPSGFLLGRLGDQPVATISAVKYGDDFGAPHDAMSPQPAAAWKSCSISTRAPIIYPFLEIERPETNLYKRNIENHKLKTLARLPITIL